MNEWHSHLDGLLRIRDADDIGLGRCAFEELEAR